MAVWESSRIATFATGAVSTGVSEIGLGPIFSSLSAGSESVLFALAYFASVGIRAVRAGGVRIVGDCSMVSSLLYN
jgi:hypothetical protein